MNKAFLIIFWCVIASLSMSQPNTPVYEYSCARCSAVWYKSVGGYAKCPNVDCENHKEGRGSSGKKIK